ncbi:hypothetical protein [Mycoplana rhizolycopersici]|uniref:Terminase small subunit n=1 Tax=Mycoplana rhizolycopersici TaxID=2746702 RepID=A0ABX2QE71_9HYPH|nr:hypothetical protein [Rhizobium rhizolycopersici]NVP56064.1 hypothetical protein [Rhizobium rhizolycopersici]
MRPTNEHDRRDLKAATNRALRKVGAANFAPETRVREAQLSKYGSLGDDENFMPLDVVADLERVLGDPMITAQLAALSGFRLVPDASGTRPLTMAQVGAVADTKGKLLSALIAALLDNHVDPHERRELLPLVRNAIAQLQDLEKALIGGAT